MLKIVTILFGLDVNRDIICIKSLNSKFMRT